MFYSAGLLFVSRNSLAVFEVWNVNNEKASIWHWVEIKHFLQLLGLGMKKMADCKQRSFVGRFKWQSKQESHGRYVTEASWFLQHRYANLCYTEDKPEFSWSQVADQTSLPLRKELRSSTSGTNFKKLWLFDFTNLCLRFHDITILHVWFYDFLCYTYRTILHFHYFTSFHNFSTTVSQNRLKTSLIWCNCWSRNIK